MCASHLGDLGSRSRKWLNLTTLTLGAAFLGILLGYANIQIVNNLSDVIANIFVRILKLVSLPMIFLSIVSTIGGLKDLKVLRKIGSKTLFYTLLTTVIAATVGLILFLLLDPAAQSTGAAFVDFQAVEVQEKMEQGSYWSFLSNAIPSNFFEPFLTGNVLGALFLALLISITMLTLPKKPRENLNDFFSSAFALILKLIESVLYFMPLAIFSFMVIFLKEIRSGFEIHSLILYVTCVVGANLIQAFLVLPGLLLSKGINPYSLAKAMWPALTVAFFGKSSTGALPVTLKCAQERAGMDSKISQFTFPLCSTINMNACAAFILITFLFVSSLNGASFSYFELVSWIFIATLGAVGNAAVPMGCYFLASSFLAANNVPLHVMGAILPIYGLIDMLETAINVWSDACVSAIVSKESSL